MFKRLVSLTTQAAAVLSSQLQLQIVCVRHITSHSITPSAHAHFINHTLDHHPTATLPVQPHLHYNTSVARLQSITQPTSPSLFPRPILISLAMSKEIEYSDKYEDEDFEYR